MTTPFPLGGGRGGSRIWQLGAKISSEASYIYERSELHIRAKRVTYTSEASYLYERSEYKSAGGIFWNLQPLRVNLSLI